MQDREASKNDTTQNINESLLEGAKSIQREAVLHDEVLC